MNTLTPSSIVLLLPLLSALVILLFQKQLKDAATLISIGSSAICLLVSIVLLGAAAGVHSLFPFIHISDQISFDINALIDGQSRGMLFVVTFVGLLVHIYAQQ